MSTVSVEEIINQALQQPENARARIAEVLVSSLDQSIDKDVELAWQKEVACRLEAIDSGAVKCISWEQVREKLRKNVKT